MREQFRIAFGSSGLLASSLTLLAMAMEINAA
jgi:hypothetical protein